MDDEEEEIAQIIREHDRNQLFVAFTATPAPATVTLFGAPFDTYTEAEAIAEGYIVDVAASIISYKTLYNLHCRACAQAGRGEALSQRRRGQGAEERGLSGRRADPVQGRGDAPHLRGEREAAHRRAGQGNDRDQFARRRACAISRSSRKSSRNAERTTKCSTPSRTSSTRKPTRPFSEHAVNELKDGELIEDRFEGDDYRLMVVANKFQTGFDQPLLAGMFLDKPVVDRNAVQTVSRLNRCHEGKKDVVVVDFTNNAKAILKAFAKYRKGTPFEPEEPDQELCPKLLRGDSGGGGVHAEGCRRFREAARDRHGCPGAVLGQRAADTVSGETHRPGGAQGVRLSARPLREEPSIS